MRSRSPEDQPISFKAGSVSHVETLAEVPEEETENSGGMENGSIGMESGVEDQLRKLTLNKSASSLSQQSGHQATEQQQLSIVQEETAAKLNSEHTMNRQPSPEHVAEDEQLSEKTSSAAPSIALPSTPQKDKKTGSTTPSTSLPSTPQKDDTTTEIQTIAAALSNAASPPTKKLDSSSGDQLRQLLLNTNQAATSSSIAAASGGGVGRSTSPGLITGASSLGNGESTREGRSPSPPEEPKMPTADAQVGGVCHSYISCIYLYNSSLASSPGSPKAERGLGARLLQV